jgi:MFS family permease
VVSASFAIAAAVGGPITSRLVDRLGQNKLIPILLSLHVSTLLITIYLIIKDANLILVDVLGVISGALFQQLVHLSEQDGKKRRIISSRKILLLQWRV